MALAVTQVGVVLALQPAANRWLRRTRPWTAVVAGNAVILTVFLWHMTAAAIAAVVLYPTGVMAQPPDPLRGVAAVASAMDSVLHRHPRRPGRPLRPDRTAPAGAASRRARAVARRRDRDRNGRRAGRAARRCGVWRLPRPHRAPMGCSYFVPVRCRCAARGTNPTCSVGSNYLIARADLHEREPTRRRCGRQSARADRPHGALENLRGHGLPHGSDERRQAIADALSRPPAVFSCP